ncbi:unnamed protein product [Trypanosoma congolense IL3000]|uniref:WGS project CAEQ00000000 data, annotated contig 1383 n=1 Tax=Trypanosoma congolense (strain IL3000) TaxID=1068625 RepID=F9W5V2_TRYCI|nr:unnamed protein product [Trypanosoma congolense IL3000]
MMRHTMYRKHVQEVTEAYESLCMTKEDAVLSHVCEAPQQVVEQPPSLPQQDQTQQQQSGVKDTPQEGDGAVGEMPNNEGNRSSGTFDGSTHWGDSGSTSPCPAVTEGVKTDPPGGLPVRESPSVLDYVSCADERGSPMSDLYLGLKSSKANVTPSPSTSIRPQYGVLSIDSQESLSVVRQTGRVESTTSFGAGLTSQNSKEASGPVTLSGADPCGVTTESMPTVMESGQADNIKKQVPRRSLKQSSPRRPGGSTTTSTQIGLEPMHPNNNNNGGCDNATDVRSNGGIVSAISDNETEGIEHRPTDQALNEDDGPSVHSQRSHSPRSPRSPRRARPGHALRPAEGSQPSVTSRIKKAPSAADDGVSKGRKKEPVASKATRETRSKEPNSKGPIAPSSLPAQGEVAQAADPLNSRDVSRNTGLSTQPEAASRQETSSMASHGPQVAELARRYGSLHVSILELDELLHMLAPGEDGGEQSPMKFNVSDLGEKPGVLVEYVSDVIKMDTGLLKQLLQHVRRHLHTSGDVNTGGLCAQAGEGVDVVSRRDSQMLAAHSEEVPQSAVKSLQPQVGDATDLLSTSAVAGSSEPRRADDSRLSNKVREAVKAASPLHEASHAISGDETGPGEAVAQRTTPAAAPDQRGSSPEGKGSGGRTAPRAKYPAGAAQHKAVQPATAGTPGGRRALGGKAGQASSPLTALSEGRTPSVSQVPQDSVVYSTASVSRGATPNAQEDRNVRGSSTELGHLDCSPSQGTQNMEPSSTRGPTRDNVKGSPRLREYWGSTVSRGAGSRIRQRPGMSRDAGPAAGDKSSDATPVDVSETVHTGFPVTSLPHLAHHPRQGLPPTVASARQMEHRIPWHASVIRVELTDDVEDKRPLRAREGPSTFSGIQNNFSLIQRRGTSWMPAAEHPLASNRTPPKRMEERPISPYQIPTDKDRQKLLSDVLSGFGSDVRGSSYYNYSALRGPAQQVKPEPPREAPSQVGDRLGKVNMYCFDMPRLCPTPSNDAHFRSLCKLIAPRLPKQPSRQPVRTSRPLSRPLAMLNTANVGLPPMPDPAGCPPSHTEGRLEIRTTVDDEPKKRAGTASLSSLIRNRARKQLAHFEIPRVDISLDGGISPGSLSSSEGHTLEEFCIERGLLRCFSRLCQSTLGRFLVNSSYYRNVVRGHLRKSRCGKLSSGWTSKIPNSLIKRRIQQFTTNRVRAQRSTAKRPKGAIFVKQHGASWGCREDKSTWVLVPLEVRGLGGFHPTAVVPRTEFQMS